MKTLVLAAVLLLSGCYMPMQSLYQTGNPDKKIVRVGNYEVGVVPRGVNRWDAYGYADGRKSADTDMPTLKARAIEAVEIVSKCKVTGAEFFYGTPFLQTTVSCD